MTWSAEDVTVKRGAKTLLDAVSVHMEPGVTALLGPNGSGKTTLLRVLAGLLRPDSGAVVGTESWREPEWARMVASAIDPSQEEIPFCVEEVLLSSQYPDGGRWLDPSFERQRPLAALLDRLEVFPDSDGLERAYATLSAGERQLIDVARAVLQPTPVLLLDEPTSALDLRHRLLVADLLKEEARARGRTVILSQHDVAEAQSFDRVLVLHRGRLVASGPPAVLDEALLARVWNVAFRDGGFRLL